MSTVTLTTDLGLHDHYVAWLRGCLLTADPTLRLVDISHHLPRFDLVRGSFVFRNAWRHFPEGTIHLVSVYDQPAPSAGMLIFEHKGHFFIGPDNGFFSLAFPGADLRMFGNTYPPGADLYLHYAQTIARLVREGSPAALAPALSDWQRRSLLAPIEKPNEIRGTVIHTDRFGNAFTNIHRAAFERVGRGRPFELYFRRHEPLRSLSSAYHEVPVGMPLCRFGTADVLEISVNSGNASELLGLVPDGVVLVLFAEA